MHLPTRQDGIENRDKVYSEHNNWEHALSLYLLYRSLPVIMVITGRFKAGMSFPSSILIKILSIAQTNSVWVPVVKLV